MDSDGFGLARGARHRASGGAPPECGVHRPSERLGCPLSAGVHDSAAPGQPLRAHFQRDPGLLGDAPQPVQVRADSYAWLLAEYRGDPLWQDDAHVPAADSGAIQSGTERAYSVGDRRNQRDASGPSLEGVRTTGGHLRGGLIIWICVTETIY